LRDTVGLPSYLGAKQVIPTSSNVDGQMTAISSIIGE
jgi:hypothetical protein